MSYVPSSTKDLKDVICWPYPGTEEDRKLQIKILDKLIKEYGGDQSESN
jgi:hypothetical protein